MYENNHDDVYSGDLGGDLGGYLGGDYCGKIFSAVSLFIFIS